MLYLKSALAGWLAVVVAIMAVPLLGVLGIVLYSVVRSSQQAPESSQQGSVGWDPISLWHQSPWPVVLLIALVFAAGFFWELRRLGQR